MDNMVLKKQWFLKTREGKIDDYYDVDSKKVLGSGSFGSVVRGKLKNTKTNRAIKIIPKNKVKDAQRLTREIDIMRDLDHPNIVKLYETFEDTRNIYIAMELCEGGELFDRISEKGQYSEKEAKETFKNLMQAVNYCHSRGVAHRDLKPENFLYLSKAEDSSIKVIDFGVSAIFSNEPINVRKVKDKKLMTTKTGTPYYMSPEVLLGQYDESCDIWSMGAILYILLSGVPPFNGDNDSEILEQVRLLKYSFDIPEFKAVSDEAKDLIRQMLSPLEKRLKAADCLKHKWLTSATTSDEQLCMNYDSLKSFSSFNKLKKVTLTFMASQLSEQEIQQLGKAFKALDKNDDGVLTIEEIQIGLQGISGKKLQDIQSVMKSVDMDGSGVINYTEFLAATIEKNIYMSQEKLYQAFKMFDIDGSGKISQDELQETLGKNEHYKNVPSSFWAGIIKEADKNGDGEIDYEEFAAMMDKIKI